MGSSSSDLMPPSRQQEGPLAPGQDPYAAIGPLQVPRRVAAAQGGYSLPRSVPATMVQTTKMVRNPCNVRKETVTLIRNQLDPERHFIQFRYDSDVPCEATIYFLADERVVGGRLRYQPRYAGADMVSGPMSLAPGTNQLFSSSQCAGHRGFNLGSARDDELNGDVPGRAYPLTIVLAPSGEQASGVFSQITLGNLEVVSRRPPGGATGGLAAGDGAFSFKLAKQKLETADGIFVLQEIYGIAGGPEGPGADSSSSGGEAEAGDGHISTADCVVCMTNKRELAILPCRHLCVCRFCAAECLQSLESKCPICRNPAQALLKLTRDDTAAAVAATAGSSSPPSSTRRPGPDTSYMASSSSSTAPAAAPR